MKFQREITPSIVIADQPTEADLASLEERRAFVGS